MAKKKFDKQEMHARAIKNIYTAFGGTQEQRDEIGEDKRFAEIAGAQWEGSTNAGFEMNDMAGFPRIECNEIPIHISKVDSEYRRNRMTVRFRPSGNQSSQELAEQLNDSFRADWKESNGKEALDEAFKSCLLGGYSCVRMEAELEDEYDPLNEDLKVTFNPVYDCETSVYFDLNAKSYDKSDARWAAEIFTLTPEEAEDEYGTRDFSCVHPSDYQVMFDWSTPDVVYISRYYWVQLEDTEIQSFINPMTKQQVIYDLDDLNIDDDEYKNDDLEVEGSDDDPEYGDISVYRELIDSGFEPIGKPRKMKKRVVYCGIMSGGEWLKEPYKIPGEHIPLVPMYGHRTFIDNQERVRGMVRMLKDMQRLRNFTLSMAMDNAQRAMGDNIKIINIDGLPESLEEEWADYVTKRPAYLSVTSLRDANDNIVAQSPVVGDTGVTQMSPALVNLITYSDQAMRQIGGFNDVNNIPSNIAVDTVDAIFNRMDNTSYIFMDNAAKTLRRIGEVWLSMKRQITGSMKIVNMIDEEGEERSAVFQGEIIDKKTGKKVGLNDLSVGKYDVDIDVGESTDSRRKEASKAMLDLLSKVPPTSPRFNQLLDFYLMSMDGYKLDDMQEMVRKDLLVAGVVQPKNEAEKREIAEKQQAAAEQPDPQMELIKAEQQKAQAEMVNAQTRAQEVQIKGITAQANAQKAQSETVKNYVEAESISKKDVLEAMRIMREARQDTIADALRFQEQSTQ